MVTDYSGIKKMCMKEEYLAKAKKEKWKVCTYGLGYLGKRLRHEIPEMFGLEPYYYCDSNDDKVDAVVFDDSVPIHKNQIKALSEPIIVFILVDDPFDLEIENDLKENKNLYTYTLRQLALMDKVIHDFYGDEMFEMYKKL